MPFVGKWTFAANRGFTGWTFTAILGAMLPIHELVIRLKALPKKDFRRAIQETGIPSRTVRNIRNGATQNPRIHTVEPLSAWLELHAVIVRKQPQEQQQQQQQSARRSDYRGPDRRKQYG